MNQTKYIRKLYGQGCDYMVRWAGRSSAPDLDLAYVRFRELDGLVADDSDFRILVDSQLGFCLASRYTLTHSASDRDEAIDRLRRVMSSSQPAEVLGNCQLALGGLITQRALAKPAVELDELQDAETMLLAAAESPALGDAQRATAREAHRQVRAMLAIARSWATLAEAKIPDIEALIAEHQQLPADEPVVGPLAAVLGLALGIRSYSSGRPDDRHRAVDYLADGLGRADHTEPWYTFTLTFLAILLAQGVLADAETVPAGRIIKLAEYGLADGAPDAEHRGLYHALAFYAYHARADRENRTTDNEVALAHLNKARGLLPKDHDVSRALLGSTSGFLSSRGTASGGIDDTDAALAFIQASHGLPGFATWLADGDPGSPFGGRSAMAHPSNYQGVTALLRAFDALEGQDEISAAHAISEAETNLAAMPADSPARAALMFGLGLYRQRRARLMTQGGSDASDQDIGELAAGLADGARAELIAGLRLVVQAGEQVTRGDLLDGSLRVSAADAQAKLGLLSSDPHLIDTAIRRLRQLTGPGLGSAEIALARITLGQVMCQRFVLTGDRRDLNNGIVHLEQVCEEADQVPGSQRVGALWALAEFYRLRDDANRRDRQQAIETGLLALEERAAEVLLQTGAERGLRATADTSSRGARLMSWCLHDDRLVEAVQTLEMGRALVLHATTLAPDIPALLRSVDQADLADRWEENLTRQHHLPWNSRGGSQRLAVSSALIDTSASADLFEALGQGFLIPEDVRRQVLDVLRDCWPDAGWLAPPTIADLTAGLRQVGCDAFVYLVPADLTRHRDRSVPGIALLLGADGAIEALRLPRLTGAPVAEFDQAHLASFNAPRDEELWHRWRAALDELCGWAWDAVMGPLLSHLARWRLGHLPRLVLIPTGRLGAVPWHAARTPQADGTPHYAMQDAVISYAASARQLATASGRARRSWAEQPVLVSNPTGDLFLAGIEGRELRRRFYPGAVLLGRPRELAAGPGTPREVLARLPGGDEAEASLLHCGCHATVSGSLASSYLELAAGQRLTIAEIMAQAEGRDPRAPGFLAVLSACMSDLADVDHDEALTLASALLAAGAVGVIGSRWSARDLETAQLMVMFHHFLNAGSAGRPADALRAAQLWMLDPGRQCLADLPPLLADETSSPTLAEIHAWAGFTYQGA